MLYYTTTTATGWFAVVSKIKISRIQSMHVYPFSNSQQYKIPSAPVSIKQCVKQINTINKIFEQGI